MKCEFCEYDMVGDDGICKNVFCTGWHPISTAPKGKEIRVRMKDGTVYENAHWASDLSGEEQPPFQGWFIKHGNEFVEIPGGKYADWSALKMWEPAIPKEWQHIKSEAKAGKK